MKKKLIMALIVANGLFAGSLMAFGGEGGANCCKETSGGEPYCCDSCCWFIDSCDNDTDCRLN